MNSLFPQPTGQLLPGDGAATYLGPVLTSAEASDLFRQFEQTLDWQHDTLIMFGRPVVTKRKVAWYGDNGHEYGYSGTRHRALPWTAELFALKLRIEAESGASFNACLLNYYHSGDEGMGWHSDDEREMGPVIASLSLGAARTFAFRHKQTRQTLSLTLEHGSLLLMHAPCQQFWHHALPKMSRVRQPRINLTFRQYIS